uniref:Uncharacterized protein n=1 Tax=Zea mays TaxID=4577 RepID=A0A804N8S0_MAIZE
MDPDFELEFEMVGVLRAYKTTWDDGDSAAAAAATDVDLLKRAWLNEKAASDILSFDSPLASGSDRGSLSWCRVTQEEALDDFVDDGVDDLVVSLYQMDLDRTLFLLRSYLLLEKEIKKSPVLERVGMCPRRQRHRPANSSLQIQTALGTKEKVPIGGTSSSTGARLVATPRGRPHGNAKGQAGSCGLPLPVFPIGGTWLALTWPNRARLAQARVTEDKGRDAAAYPQTPPRNADTQ